jgi:hypothetical protein
MIINDDILRRDTVRLITTIDAQIDVVAEEAKSKGIESIRLIDSYGNWPMIQLLQAKAQAYNTLVLLQTKMRS